MTVVKSVIFLPPGAGGVAKTVDINELTGKPVMTISKMVSTHSLTLNIETPDSTSKSVKPTIDGASVSCVGGVKNPSGIKYTCILDLNSFKTKTVNIKVDLVNHNDRTFTMNIPDVKIK